MQKICYKEIEIIFQNADEKKVVFIYKEKQIVIKLSKSRGFINGRTIVADLIAYFVYIECCFDELENRIKIGGVGNAIEIIAAFRDEQPQFDKFAKVLENTQTRLAQANKELDTLVGVRTRAIQRKLSQVKEPQLGRGKDAEESE